MGLTMTDRTTEIDGQIARIETALTAAKEAVAVARGEKRMMCWACGSIVRAPEFRCDCTKAGRPCQRIVPVPDESSDA